MSNDAANINQLKILCFKNKSYWIQVRECTIFYPIKGVLQYETITVKNLIKMAMQYKPLLLIRHIQCLLYNLLGTTLGTVNK